MAARKAARAESRNRTFLVEHDLRTEVRVFVVCIYPVRLDFCACFLLSVRFFAFAAAWENNAREDKGIVEPHRPCAASSAEGMRVHVHGKKPAATRARRSSRGGWLVEETVLNDRGENTTHKRQRVRVVCFLLGGIATWSDLDQALSHFRLQRPAFRQLCPDQELAAFL